MLKKFLVSAALLAGLTTGGAFAAKDSGNVSVNLGLAFPQLYDFNSPIENIDSESYSAWGINFGARMPLSGFTGGVYLDADLYFPYAYKVKQGDTTYSYKLADFDSFWGIDGTIGGYYVLFNNNILTVPVGIGPHFNFYKNKVKQNDTVTVSNSLFSFGLGSFANAELKLGDLVTLYAGVRLDFDFFQHQSHETSESNAEMPNGQIGTKTTTSSENQLSSIFTVVPAIGAIFRF